MSEQGPSTICRCGLAKSYHDGPFGKDDHAYEPRYEPEAWREGYRAGRAVQDGLDPERLRQAMFQHLRNYGLRPHKCNELCAPELADEYVAAPPSKPVHGEVDRL